LADAFMLTGFFLERRVTEPRGQTLPDARSHFIAAVLRMQPPLQSQRA
jgi:DNA repair protein RecO (recombination protein O)